MGSDPNYTIPIIIALARAQHVVMLTGSGTSAESGIPTFRDAQTGLWAKYRPEDLATPEAFKRNPRLVWDWYVWRRELVEAAQPNPGHDAIAELDGLAMQAQRHGALFFEINPDATPLTSVADFALSGPSGRILPELVAALRTYRQRRA